MASAARLRTDSDDDSVPESGEDIDDEDPKAHGPKTPHDGAMEKRKRGKVWQNVILEDELSSSLSKVSTDELRLTGVPVSFVDLDAPTTSGNSAAVSLSSGNVANHRGKRGAGRGSPGTRRAESVVSQGASGDGPVVGQNGEIKSTSGEKRKNTLTPKSKRKSGEKTHFFTKYPDWSAEILDEEPLHIAAQKACIQLDETWSKWTITQIVSQLGNAETRKLLAVTKTIEENGGMNTKVPGGGRRTPGGVFITLFKSDAEKKLGKDAVKKLLTPPSGPRQTEKQIEKHRKSLVKRSERRLEARKKAASNTGDIVGDGECAMNSKEHSLEPGEIKMEPDVIARDKGAVVPEPGVGFTDIEMTEGIIQSVAVPK